MTDPSLFNNEIFTDSGKKINANRLDQIRRLARNSVIEPFEGKKSIKTIQKTRAGLEKSSEKIISVSKKTGRLISQSKLAQLSKKKFNAALDDLKESGAKVSPKWLGKINEAVSEIQDITKKNYQNLEEKARDLSITTIQKGLKLVLYEDTETWILKRVQEVLQRKDCKELEQIRNLSVEERQTLTKALYPYDSLLFSSFMKSFDVSLNVGLGVVVATNLPGSGLATSLVNMAKTIVKLANRINIMSGIYGYKVSSPQALFRVSATILQSLDDSETNPDHLPLDPIVLEKLFYQSEIKDENALQDMFGQLVKKEAYIAIPGVGMISLGKINLDDVKMDLVVKNLMEDFFIKKELVEELGMHDLQDILADFQMIYQEFTKVEYFDSVRKKQEAQILQDSAEKWKVSAKILTGFDIALDKVSSDLDSFVTRIYLKIRQIEQDDKLTSIKKEIKELLGEKQGIK